MDEKYFLYARKSTDTEDKQVLSIEAQIVELRKYARDNNFVIVDELIEKKTAKMPGRKVFNAMLARTQNGEANGILAWHPDRLARNSIDGGQIVYLLDQTIINYLRFPMFQFENTSQGKFMLSIMFGQSKYYVDNLAENVKRGLRQKIRVANFLGLRHSVTIITRKLKRWRWTNPPRRSRKKYLNFTPKAKAVLKTLRNFCLSAA